MEYLDVRPMAPAIEAMEELLTEISQDPLVEVDDVAEDLNGQLEQLQTTRNELVDLGVNHEAAKQLDVGIEGFLIRNPYHLFTPERSIEGLNFALEEVDDKRAGLLQRLWDFIKQKLKSFTDWLMRLFGKGGKGEEAIGQAKAAAETAKSTRKPDFVSKMHKGPAAADQEARIEPQGPKSGKFEDFVDLHVKYTENLKGDYERIISTIAGSKVLSTVCMNPEAIDGFFGHMTSIQDKSSQVRAILDKASNEVRNTRSAEETASALQALRQEMYKLFGGEDATALDSIRQTQFTDQTASKFEYMEYDELVPLMIKITGNVPAANAQQRLNELSQLNKAVDNFNSIIKNNAFKKLDPTHRNVIYTAMQGLAGDITKYVAAVTQDWSMTLSIYTSVNTFFQQEAAFYYKHIAAIQKAASETFEEADREALYENFKRLGFAVDLSPAELQRRGVGNESLDDAFALLNAAMEEIDVPHPGDVPVWGNIFASGGGLMAAMEEESNNEDKPTFMARIKAWFTRFVSWIKSFFVRQVDTAEKKSEVVTEKKKEQSQKEEAFAQSQGTTREEVVSKLRPEIKEVFDKRMSDAAWYNGSALKKRVDAFLQDRKSAMYVGLAGKNATDVRVLADDIANHNTRLWLAFKAASTVDDIVKLANGPSITAMQSEFQKLQGFMAGANLQLNSVADVCKMIQDTSKATEMLRSNRWYAFKGNIAEAMSKLERVVGGDFNAQPADIQDAAKRIQSAMNACMTLFNMVTHTYSLVCFPTYVEYKATVAEMFANEENKPSAGEISLMGLDPRWNVPFKL